MLPIITFDQKYYDPVLGSTYKTVQSIDTLERLARLHDALSSSRLMRNKALSALKELFETALAELTADNYEHVGQTIRKGLSQLKTGIKDGKNLELIYAKAISNAKNATELKKCISKLIKDSSSIQTFLLQKTNKGQNGPTHLVSYTRSSKKCSLPTMRSYVVKWSNSNEMCCSRLYDVFSKILSPKNFSVPKIAVMDFENALHESSDWNSVSLDQDVINHLKQSVLGTIGKSIQIHDSKLILMEKVKGSNLIDFAESKYPYLKEEEKIDLFRKMGHLAMLDLLTGNTDRLIQTEYDVKTNQYQLKELTANLGNLMIEWFPDEGKPLELYAIDNGLNTLLIENRVHKESYLLFLQGLLQDESHRAVLTGAIVRSIQKSFDDVAEQLVENSKHTLQETMNRFRIILDDLQKDSLQMVLSDGLEEMYERFHQILVPFWNSEKALKIKNYLKDNQPELLDAISTRFQLFKKDIMQFNPETALINWLTAIESHSKEGSFESRKAVLELSKELPDCASLPSDIREMANKIKELAESKNWDPSLSPNSAKLLNKICKDYTRSSEPKSLCAKKLTF